MQDYLLWGKQTWHKDGEVFCRHCGRPVIKRLPVGGGYFAEEEYFCKCEQAKRVYIQRSIVELSREKLESEMSLLEEMTQHSCVAYEEDYTQRMLKNFISAKGVDKNVLLKVLSEEGDCQ